MNLFFLGNMTKCHNVFTTSEVSILSWVKIKLYNIKTFILYPLQLKNKGVLNMLLNSVMSLNFLLACIINYVYIYIKDIINYVKDIF